MLLVQLDGEIPWENCSWNCLNCQQERFPWRLKMSLKQNTFPNVDIIEQLPAAVLRAAHSTERGCLALAWLMVQFVEIAKVSRGHTLKITRAMLTAKECSDRSYRYLPRQKIRNFGRKLRKSQQSIPGIKWQIVSLAAADRWNQIYPYLKLKLSVTFMVIIFALPTQLHSLFALSLLCSDLSDVNINVELQMIHQFSQLRGRPLLTMGVYFWQIFPK